jgi:hypothetical protein
MPLPRLPRTAAAIESRMGALHVGAQLHVSLGGEVVADAAWGLYEDLGLARPPAMERGPGETARPA